MDGVVLAIHGEKRDAGLARRGHHHGACGNQDFLVGQRDGLATADGSVRGRQAHHAHRSRNHDVRVRMRGHGVETRGAEEDFRERRGRGVLPFPQELAQLLRARFIRHRDDLGAMLDDLLGHAVDALARGQRHHLQAFREGLHHLKALSPDRAG